MIDETVVRGEVEKLFSRNSEYIKNYILKATAISIGIFDFKGKPLILNKGFKDMIESDSTDLRTFFITPNFNFFLNQAESKGQSVIYEGLLTLGTELENKSFKTCTITNDSFLLFLCESDVSELDHINSEMRSLNQRLNDSQHQLIRKEKALMKSIADLKLAQSKLIESEKMASLGRLVAGFAHEINTPVGIALTASSSIMDSSQYIDQMLMQDEVEEEDLTSTLETIRDSSRLVFSNLKRAAGLVGSFKRTSIDQSTENFTFYNLKDTILDVLTSMGIKIKSKSIKTDFECHEDIDLYGNPGDIFQIISNLYENSILHGFDNGKLKGEISILVQKEDKEIFIHYSDTGKGMSPEIVERIFEPFFTTMRAKGGTGLGMYICHNIVTSRLKGTIDCKSTEGQGVNFLITVPMAKEENSENYKNQE